MTVFANDGFLTGPKISHFQGFTEDTFLLILPKPWFEILESATNIFGCSILNGRKTHTNIKGTKVVE
jgi:hypothetical protein